MLFVILAILIGLWFLGYAPMSGVSFPNIVLFSFNNHQITLLNILILLAVGWAISILPRPFREIASVLLLFWVLSVVGILAIAGLSNILLIAIIVGFGYYIIQGSLLRNRN